MTTLIFLNLHLFKYYKPTRNRCTVISNFSSTWKI